ncbi:MAG: hypothetical protein ACRDT6_15085 [Micromonosporaceae bacterium]
MRTKMIAAVIAGAAVAGVLAATPAASAATVVDEYSYTAGEIPRRVTLLREGNDLIGEALVRDRAGAPNYDVSVSRVQLQWYSYSSQRWITLYEEGDYDGWRPEWDHAVTPWSTGSTGKWRVIALFKWRRYGSTATPSQQWMVTDGYWV